MYIVVWLTPLSDYSFFKSCLTFFDDRLFIRLLCIFRVEYDICSIFSDLVRISRIVIFLVRYGFFPLGISYKAFFGLEFLLQAFLLKRLWRWFPDLRRLSTKPGPITYHTKSSNHLGSIGKQNQTIASPWRCCCLIKTVYWLPITTT